jgi:hypothetical protein
LHFAIGDVMNDLARRPATVEVSINVLFVECGDGVEEFARGRFIINDVVVDRVSPSCTMETISSPA